MMPLDKVAQCDNLLCNIVILGTSDMKKMLVEKITLTRKEAAGLLGISPGTVTQ
ncbi:hypothetical protein [Pantoea piersonii]|uniref:hypothetical protein n=1 Tax=Pantoea piersonii TaxID=2364647 RepID=UPI0022F1C4AE|nr:hypothetical protein [Pantoea piersonii]WBV23049.1 hypothetical protein PG877_07850 [Pantoea piersonii]